MKIIHSVMIFWVACLLIETDKYSLPHKPSRIEKFSTYFKVWKTKEWKSLFVFLDILA